MNGHACCARRRAPATGAAPTTLARRGMAAAGWLVPSALLALLPKCPVCFAAYFALATSVGISAVTAWYLRTGLAALCTAVLAVLAVRLLLRWARARSIRTRSVAPMVAP